MKHLDPSHAKKVIMQSEIISQPDQVFTLARKCVPLCMEMAHGRRGGLKIRFFGVWVRVPPGARNLLNWEAYSPVAQLAERATVNR